MLLQRDTEPTAATTGAQKLPPTNTESLQEAAGTATGGETRDKRLLLRLLLLIGLLLLVATAASAAVDARDGNSKKTLFRIIPAIKVVRKQSERSDDA